jgi:hypothetical protein
MSNEVWKEIPTLVGYEASNFGRIRRKGCKSRRLQLNKSGYLYVGVRVNGKFRNLRVHRLVASAFLPKPEGKDFINHKNGDKTDNSVDNLEWCTASENELHKVWTHHKKQTPPVNLHRIIDTDTGIAYESIKEAAAATGANRHHIGEVALGKRKSTNGRHFRYACGSNDGNIVYSWKEPDNGEQPSASHGHGQAQRISWQRRHGLCNRGAGVQGEARHLRLPMHLSKCSLR